MGRLENFSHILHYVVVYVFTFSQFVNRVMTYVLDILPRIQRQVDLMLSDTQSQRTCL